MTSEFGDICLHRWMKLTLCTFRLVLVDLYRMLFSTTISFADISAQDCPILALFVLIDRTTCQLTSKSVIASSVKHYFCILVIFLKCTYFPEIDTKNASFEI